MDAMFYGGFECDRKEENGTTVLQIKSVSGHALRVICSFLHDMSPLNSNIGPFLMMMSQCFFSATWSISICYWSWFLLQACLHPTKLKDRILWLCGSGSSYKLHVVEARHYGLHCGLLAQEHVPPSQHIFQFILADLGPPFISKQHRRGNAGPHHDGLVQAASKSGH